MDTLAIIAQQLELTSGNQQTLTKDDKKNNKRIMKSKLERKDDIQTVWINLINGTFYISYVQNWI